MAWTLVLMVVRSRWVDDVDAGDDFDEVFDRGEGPETSGEGVSVGMLGEFTRG